MNYIRYALHDEISYGWLDDERVGAITGDLFGDYIRVGYISTLDKVKLLPPTRPSKIIALSRNYQSRVEALGIEPPDLPIFFFKPPSTLIGYGDPILLPPQSKQVEHEAELAVVIGRRARFVSVEDADKFIFGYTCANDITARDLHQNDTFINRSKSFDTFLALGPWITTTLDPADAIVSCRVNGQLRQMASTREMHFSVPQIVAYLTSIMTLEPGDVILTGTPAGAAPLKDGDKVEVDIEGIGSLRNPVMSPPIR